MFRKLLLALVLLVPLAAPATVLPVAGGRELIVGLSSDSKPASANGVVFMELDTGAIFLRSGGNWVEQHDGGGGGGAPTTSDYLVGTTDAGLSAEIVVGTTPGGDLGGTWGTPSVDDDSHNHGASTISGLDAGDTTTGTFADARVDGSLESDEVTGLTDAQISDTLTASTSTTAAANDSDTSIATTAFVQQEIDDGDFLTDNCVLENDSTPIPDSCVGDGSDAGGGGGGISYAEAVAAVLAGF